MICLPDFFTMNEEVSVARSEFLLNVYRNYRQISVDMYGEGEKRPITKFERGYFEFYSRKRKQLLFDIAKTTKRKSYKVQKPDFFGRFTHVYPIDETKYRQYKAETIRRLNKGRDYDGLTPTMRKLYDYFVDREKKEKESMSKIANKIGINPSQANYNKNMLIGAINRGLGATMEATKPTIEEKEEGSDVGRDGDEAKLDEKNDGSGLVT